MKDEARMNVHRVSLLGVDAAVSPSRACVLTPVSTSFHHLPSFLPCVLRHRAPAVISKRVRNAAATWFLHSSVARLRSPASRIVFLRDSWRDKFTYFSPPNFLKPTSRSVCGNLTLRTGNNVGALPTMCIPVQLERLIVALGSEKKSSSLSKWARSELFANPAQILNI